MAFKLLSLVSLVAFANAGLIHHQPAVVSSYTAVDSEHDPHPQYSYAYDVQDALTGDSKSQHETRDGDVVHGSYSVNDPDGTKRTVDYTADPINGFNAVVRKEPTHTIVKTVAPAPVAYAAAPAVVAKTVVPAPAVAYAAAPTVVSKTVVSAPALTYAAAPAPAVAYASAPAVYKTYQPQVYAAAPTPAVHLNYASAPHYYHQAAAYPSYL